MEQFTVKEWITLLSPLILVFIAGYIALRNQRKSIRLQAKNKWKEDFRLHIAEYIETYISCIFHAAEFNSKRNENLPTEEKIYVVAQSMSKALANFSKIQLMLNEEDTDSQELIKLSKNQGELLTKYLSGKEKEENANIFINEFTIIAKKIYDKE